MSIKPSDRPYGSKQDLAINSRKSPTYGKIHLLDLPRCDAKKRKKDERCQAPAMTNGRCRIHGGLSTGPKTPEGLSRSRKANWRHGLYSQESKEEVKAFKQVLGMLVSPDQTTDMSPEEAEAQIQAMRRLSGKFLLNRR